MNPNWYHRLRTNKYGAKPTDVDGIRFHSQREATRYGELKLLERAGHIHDLERQPRFPLRADVSSRRTTLDRLLDNIVGTYVADFQYTDHKRGVVVEEVKGYDYPLGKWKRKHCEMQYGITVTVVK